jgi:phage tail-like protein
VTRAAGYLELDLAGAELTLLLDGVVVDPATGAATLARVPAAPEPIGPPLDPAAAFSGPAGIAVTRAGDVFVADPVGHRILRIGPCETAGAPLRCVTGPGAEPGLVDTPRGVATGPRGRLFVADSGNDRVQAFDLGTFQVVLVIEGIDEPWELATDAAGGVYVVEHGADRVVKYDIDGAPVPAFAAAVAAQPAVPAAPVSVAVALIDGAERLVVVDGTATRPLLVYELDGTFDQARTDAWAQTVRDALAGAAAGAATVGDGRLYVSEDATGGVLVFSLEGAFLGRASGHDAGAAGLAIDGEGRLLVHPGTGQAVRLGAASFVGQGTLRLGPVAVGQDPTAWQRLHVDGDLGGGRVRLHTFTSDVPDPPPPLPAGAPAAPPALTPASQWRAAPENALDVLALNAPGRYVWIGARLESGGGSSPQLTRIRIEHDGDGWLPLLPAIYARDDESRTFLERLLALTESALDDEQELLDGLPRLLGSASAPDRAGTRWLDWLSGWLAFGLDERWTEATRRQAVAGAFELNGRRGTADGLRDLIRLTLGIEVRVREPSATAALWELGGGSSALGFGTMLAGAEAQGAVLGTTATVGNSDLIGDDELGRPLFEELASRFCIDVREADIGAPGALDQLHALVDRERPAETEAHVCVIGPRARVGAQAQLGIDAIVAGTSPSPPRPARIGDPLRVGQTTRLS